MNYLDMPNPTYEELDYVYRKYYTLGYLNTDIGSKFALISLVCFLTKQAQKKNPDATPLQVIMKCIEGKEDHHDMDFIKSVAVICQDFLRNTTEFLTFDLKSAKDIVNKIEEILNTYLPF